MLELRRLTQEEVETHYFLNSSIAASNEFWCFGDYLSDAGYQANQMNQLIFNLKTSLNDALNNAYRHNHKQQAIQAVATAMKGRYKQFPDFAFVPVPPSGESSCSQQGDTRLEEILQRADLHWAKIVNQTQDYEPSHTASNDGQSRKSLEELLQNYTVNKEEASKIKDSSKIFIFDDVITSGSHFMAMVTKLSELVPTQHLAGLFVAHTVWPPDFDAIVEESP